MADITEAIEQDAIAATLCAPLHSAYEQEAEPEYEEAAEQSDTSEPKERSEFFGAGQDQPAESPEATDELEATPAQQQEYAEAQQQWNALPESEQGALADQYLESAYSEAYASITPAEAQTFTNELGRNWNIENLASVVDPVPFAAFAESWSTHAERTVALHPAGQEFLEAIADEGHPERALQIAMKLTDPVMAQRFAAHFSNVTGQDLRGRNAVQVAAECLCDIARLQGWGASQQQGGESVGRTSPFRTNSDLFDSTSLNQLL